MPARSAPLAFFLLLCACRPEDAPPASPATPDLASAPDPDLLPVDPGPGPGALEIHYINVGWGGAVFVRGPSGASILLEAGNDGAGAARVVPYLRTIGALPEAGLDYTIAGHQHCDHIGGLDEVVQAGYDVRGRNFYNGSDYDTSCVRAWNAAAAGTSAGAPVAPRPGEQIDLGGGATLTFVAVNGAIIGGEQIAVSEENDRSIAVLLRHGAFDYLWASDLGGGMSDTGCTGRRTGQTDVESAVIRAISPGGASPLVADRGIDVLHVNHHGSESSTNANWLNLSAPSLAVISVGGGQSASWNLPRTDVVDRVLLGRATACVTARPPLVLQTEDGDPAGPLTSASGFSVGDIRIATEGAADFYVAADGQVQKGLSEVAAAGLPRRFPLSR